MIVVVYHIKNAVNAKYNQLAYLATIYTI